MASCLFRSLYKDSAFPDHFLAKIRLGIRKTTASLNHLFIGKLFLIFSQKKSLISEEAYIEHSVSLSGKFHEQDQKIRLNYSITTCLEPINFDWSIFFVTSPPHQIRI